MPNFSIMGARWMCCINRVVPFHVVESMGQRDHWTAQRVSESPFGRTRSTHRSSRTVAAPVGNSLNQVHLRIRLVWFEGRLARWSATSHPLRHSSALQLIHLHLVIHRRRTSPGSQCHPVSRRPSPVRCPCWHLASYCWSHGGQEEFHIRRALGRAAPLGGAINRSGRICDCSNDRGWK